MGWSEAPGPSTAGQALAFFIMKRRGHRIISYCIDCYSAQSKRLNPFLTATEKAPDALQGLLCISLLSQIRTVGFDPLPIPPEASQINSKLLSLLQYNYSNCLFFLTFSIVLSAGMFTFCPENCHYGCGNYYSQVQSDAAIPTLIFP